MKPITKRFFIPILTGLFSAFISIIALADGFLTILPEVPLPEKISEIAGSEVSFDAPTGRIIQVAATGSASEKDIVDFYQSTMPQLGWKALSITSFTREKEKLMLIISTVNNETLIQFELSPMNADNE